MNRGTTAIGRLAARGLLDAGSATEVGLELRRAVEATTDRLAAPAFEVLHADEQALLADMLGRVATSVVEAGALPFPNPIGLPRPGS